MTASYDCGIETNVQAWWAVRDGLADGLSLKEISGRTGMSYEIVVYYQRRRRPAGIVRKINYTAAGSHVCEDCGGPRSNAHPGASRCWGCQQKAAAAMTNLSGRRENLRAWALRNGRVPTVAEARDILGIGRSRAGDMVLASFGPDRRDGARRRMSYRGWPDGAPDVPNAEGIEAMRAEGRRSWAGRAAIAR